MRHIILLLLPVVLHVTECYAQNIYSSPTEDDSYGESYPEDNSFYEEQRRVRAARERSKIIYEEEGARREVLRTRDYESTVSRNQNRNSIDTISDATQAISQAFGTVRQAQRLFGN